MGADNLGLDWYRATFPFEKRDDVLAVIDQWENLRKVEGPGFKSWGYETRWSSEDTKSSMQFSAGLRGRARADCCLDLNGAFMSRLGGSEQFGLLRVLGALGAVERRIDVAFDDADRVVEPLSVFEAYEAGCCIGFGVRAFHNGANGGTTCELGKKGSAGSGKFLSVYDKDVESKGRVKGVRWELRLSDDRAEGAARVLRGCDSLGSFRDVLGGLIVGSVDFRNREVLKTKDNSRLPRLPWWEKIVGKLGKAERVTVPKVNLGLKEAEDWAMKTWAKTYAKLILWHEKHNGGVGFQLFLDSLRFRGEESLSEAERREIERSAPPDLDIPF